MKQNISVLYLIIILTSSAWAQQIDTHPIAITNVTVIDGTGSAPQPHMTLVIKNEIISDLFPAGQKTLPEESKILDMSGHFILPGLINTHVHLSNILLGRTTNMDFDDQHELMLAELKRMLYGGVTSIRDMAGDARLLAIVKRSIFLNRVEGPDLYYAALMGGPDFMNNDPRVAAASQGYRRGEVAWQQVITRETDLEAAVARAAGTHATGLKFYIGIDADILQLLNKEADQHGMKTWAHSTVFPDRPIDVVKSGVDVISHLGWSVWQDRDLDPRENIPYTNTPSNNPRPVFNSDLVQADSPEMLELFGEMVRQNTLFDLTLSAYKSGGGSGNDSGTHDRDSQSCK